MLDDAESKLVEDNIQLVYYICYKVLHIQPALADDAVGVAMLALCYAASKYDTTKNVKFSTYAYKIIKDDVYAFIAKEKKRGLTQISSTDASAISFVPMDNETAENLANNDDRTTENAACDSYQTYGISLYEIQSLSTPSEWEIFTMYLDGYDYREIAKHRQTAESTVRVILHSLREKIKKAKRKEAFVWPKNTDAAFT